MLKVTAVVECFLVLGLNLENAGFVVLYARFETLVALSEFDFSGFFALD